MSTDVSGNQRPYSTPLCTLFFGASKIGRSVPTHSIKDSDPLMKPFHQGQGYIWLSDVDEAITDRFMHYLYTKEYKHTLEIDLEAATLGEFENAIRLMFAAETYGLPTLKAHAEIEVNYLKYKLGPLELFSVIRKMHPYFQGREWFHSIIMAEIQSVEEDDLGWPFLLECIHKGTGQDVALDKLIIRCLLEALAGTPIDY
ncbi:uncharacterized protein MCYG_08024 [Microsporum canis CBS 113480]|uniref:BTB domain-containing protein n=1 Tax=Arthroderma otae (strain ATCC MYA-4605 / CBS 113480) TaxID=554155 RepID=C5FZA2_ARTOC|nr:uncharacterized protein MCYG_08024 [Microsporum canis CBS 113480]EEQ35205.1 predicted protein [Microsporum canis CBS 113480]